MQRKLYYLACSMLLLISYGCSGDYSEEMPETAKAVKDAAPVLKGYSEVGVIPPSALAKMTPEEADSWRKLGSKMYVNYSFLDSTFYVNGKQDILKDLMCYYNDVLKYKSEPSYLSFCALKKDNRMVGKIKRRLSFGIEDEAAGSYVGEEELWSESSYNLELWFSCSVLYADSRHAIQYSNEELTTKPDGLTSHSGQLNHNLHEASKTVSVSYVGFFFYNKGQIHKDYHINVSKTVQLYKVV